MEMAGDAMKSDRTAQYALYGITALAVLAGLYFRFKGLGFSPFAIDEYYIATSVKSILEHGVPRFEGGGFYTRGIALQYLAAGLFLTGLDHEFAFRLLTLLFNVAALPAVYLLARNLAGVAAGCLAMILYSLSVWEVEFARFARMYAPFGMLFVWHLYFLHRRIVLDDARASKWLYSLSLAAIVFSEFAVFLVLLNFLPLVLRRLQRPVFEVAVPGIILVVAYLWESIEFRRIGAGEYLPPELLADLPAQPALPIHLPPVLLPQMVTSFPWLIGFLVPLLLALCVVVGWLRWGFKPEQGSGDRLSAVVMIGIVALGLLNLFTLSFFAAVILLLLSGLPRPAIYAFARQRLVLLTGISLVVSLMFWGAYVANTVWWRALLPISTDSAAKDAFLLLFNYPNLLREVIAPWRAAMPLQWLLMGALVAVGLWYATDRDEEQRRGYSLIAAIAVLMFLLVPVFTTPYSTTRYTFFVYSALLVLIAVTVVYGVERWFRQAMLATSTSVALAAGLMFLFEDYEARHLLQIDSERVTYRIGYPRGKVDQYYLRWDFRGVAETVNEGLQPRDTVISAEYSVPYYLDRVDYLYMGRDAGRFWIVAGQRGTRDIWEGARLLSTETELFDVMQAAPGPIWLIARSEKYGAQTAAEQTASAMLDSFRVYRSVDGYLDVYRIPSARDLPIPSVIRQYGP